MGTSKIRGIVSGAYCGNPLGCAVAHAAIEHLLDHNISANVTQMGRLALDCMSNWMQSFPEHIVGFRGSGLLLAIEFPDEKFAGRITDKCLAKNLFVRQTQGNLIRIFPAINIGPEEMEAGLGIIEATLGAVTKELS